MEANSNLLSKTRKNKLVVRVSKLKCDFLEGHKRGCGVVDAALIHFVGKNEKIVSLYEHGSVFDDRSRQNFQFLAKISPTEERFVKSTEF